MNHELTTLDLPVATMIESPVIVYDPAPICGDGKLFGDEACDDGNTADEDGCSSSCTVECGYGCDGGSPTTQDTCTTVCGDGMLAGYEACDDGNAADGDGCSAECGTEVGWQCTSSGCNLSNCVWLTGNEVCGDGFTLGAELHMAHFCDDGDTVGGDGCSANCTVAC